MSSDLRAPSAPPTKVKVELDTGLRRGIGKIGLLFTGVGSIIGSGWLFGAFKAAELVGPASIISWLVGAVMIAFVALNYSELGVMFPVAGGVIRFPHYAYGSFASFTSGWITWIASAGTVGIEVLAAVQYASSYVPWLMTKDATGATTLTAAGIGISIVLVFVFCVINYFGAKFFAHFNNVLVWWKLIVIALVIVVILVLAFHPGNFNRSDVGGFAPMGVAPIFSALPAAGIVFSYLGFRQGVEFAGETDNPRKNVPFAVLGSIVITAVIYIALQVAFIGAVPDNAFKDGWAKLQLTDSGSVAGPLADVALLIGAVWLAIILFADAIISPADTGLIYTGLAPRLSYSQARVGNAPKWLTKLNKHKVPWPSLVAVGVVACFMFLPFPSWDKLVGFITSGTVLSFGSGPVVVAALRRQLPDQERPFKLPGKDIIPFIGFLCSNLIVYWTGWEENWKLFLAVALGYIILAAQYIFSHHKKDIPSLHFRAGWWMLLWMGGLFVISLLGYYGGGLKVLGFGFGELVVLVFTVVVFILAMYTRLTPREVVENVERTHTDEVEREEL